MNRYQSFRFSNGERGGLLVDVDTGLPLIYENLYTTIHHRNTSNSINTIRSTLGILCFFSAICELLKIDIMRRFPKGELLTRTEIEAIALWSKKPTSAIENAIKKGSPPKPPTFKTIEMARYRVVIDENLVKPNTTYNRITVIASYTTWLAETISPAPTKAVQLMNKLLIVQRPYKGREQSSNAPFKSLNKSQRTQLLEIVDPDSPNNPWHGKAIRYRNRLIVHLLLYIGCRKGELLTLMASDLDPGTRLLKIRRCADDIEDPRASPALVKTLGRDIEVTDEIYAMIEDYIIQYRAKVKGSNKCGYLLISHHSTSSVALPLSHPSIDKIFATLSKSLKFSVHPHALRHTWNDDFSEQIEPLLASGEMSESEVEDLRSYFMGWKEGSGTAETYTKRYMHKKALLVGLQLQKKSMYADMDRKNSKNTDTSS